MKEIRPEKKAILAEIKGLIEESSYMILVGYKGLTVEGITDLRSRVRPSGSRVTVVRNTFLQRIIDDMGWDGAKALVEGPVAIITGSGDVAGVSKILQTFATETKIMVIKGGTMGGDVLTADEVNEIASLPSRDVMLAITVGAIAAPLTAVVGVMNQKVSSLLYVLKAVESKKNES
jgi:large subunit ribosomal protein L10